MPIPFEKSFESHPRSKNWSKKNEKKPRDVFKGSDKKYLFDCDKCFHEFESSLNNITSNHWCGFCSNPPKKLCDNENCEMCLNKSFASHLKKDFWSSKNGNIRPRDVFKCDHSKYLFDCDQCGHEFEITLNHITNGQWCGYCSNPPNKLCNDENCETCFNKSFASHPKKDFWSDKNVKKPINVFKSSASKCLFVCENGHEFKSRLADISKGVWCPFCKKKTETKLYELIISFYPSIITQFKQDWCKKINHLPFDFCIPEPKIIIELDGRQHFIQIWNWQSPEISFENDKYKEKCANENGYSTIRIIQEDVLYDKYDWCKELCDAIENIKNGDKIVNIYLCKNNEYDLFM